MRLLQPFGVALDLDLRCDEVADELRRAFVDHGLVVVHGQELTLDDQRRMMGRLGPVLDDWSTVGYVSNRRPDGTLANLELSFHIEASASPQPFLGLSLHAVDVAGGVSATRFASSTRALGALAPGLRRRLHGLHVRNLFPTSEAALTGRQRGDDYPADAPFAEHPLVDVDPVTGAEVLMANQMQTDGIIGLPRAESEELLAQLYARLYAPDNVYEHQWRNGDVVIWSNAAYQHARRALDPGAARTLQRVCITEGSTAAYAYPRRRR